MQGISLAAKSVWIGLLLAAGLALAALPVAAVAAVYRVTIISQDADPYRYSSYHGAWKLNNRGEVVFSREKIGDPADQAIFLYSGGRVSRLSPMDKSSQKPDLNDRGEVTWQNWYYDYGDFNPKYEKCLHSGGQTTLIEGGMYANLAPLVNNRSQVLYPTDGNGLLRTRFWLYDQGTKTPITDGEHIDDNYALNDLDPESVAWVRSVLQPDAVYLNGSVIAPSGDCSYYILKLNNLDQVLYIKTENYVENLWLYNGQEHVLIRGNTQAGADFRHDLNNRSQVAYTVWEGNQYQVYLYDQGNSTKITPPGCLAAKYAKINNRGQVVMTASTPVEGGYQDQFWLYEAGRFTQVTYGTGNYISMPQFNDRGQIAWQSVHAMFLASPVGLPPVLLLLD